MTIDALHNFKVQTVLVAYDTAISQIKETFIETTLGIYKDLVLISWQYIEDTAANNDSLPKDAFDAIADVYSKFIQKYDLKREYLQFSKSYFNFKKFKLLSIQLHDSTFDSDDQLHGYYQMKL